MELMPVRQEQGKRKKDTEGENLRMAAAAVGLVAAAAATMGAGAVAAGAGLGSAGLNVYGTMRKPPNLMPNVPGQLGYGETAVSRRLKQTMGDPLAELENARRSLAQIDLPDDLRLEYEKPLNMALEKYKTRYS